MRKLGVDPVGVIGGSLCVAPERSTGASMWSCWEVSSLDRREEEADPGHWEMWTLVPLLWELSPQQSPFLALPDRRQDRGRQVFWPPRAVQVCSKKKSISADPARPMSY